MVTITVATTNSLNNYHHLSVASVHTYFSLSGQVLLASLILFFYFFQISHSLLPFQSVKSRHEAILYKSRQESTKSNWLVVSHFGTPRDMFEINETCEKKKLHSTSTCREHYCTRALCSS